MPGRPVLIPRILPESEHHVVVETASRRPVHVGVNYAYWNFGTDFGDPAWGERRPWRDSITRELQVIRDSGIDTVRVFLLGDGLNYGMRRDGIDHRPQPIFTDGEVTGWSFEPVDLPYGFLEDFVAFLVACRSVQIKIIPVLVGFEFCGPAVMDTWHGSDVVAFGRSQLFNDAAKRESFLTRVLDPLLQAAQPYADSIYAWDVFNEPEWITIDGNRGADRERSPIRDFFRGPSVSPTADHPVGLSAMVEYIRSASSRIVRAGFASTVGFSSQFNMIHWEREFGDFGITLPQFHYYSGPLKSRSEIVRALTDAGVSQERARIFAQDVFIGEAPTRHAPGENFDGCPSQSVLDRLYWLESKGYNNVVLWSADVRGNPAVPDPSNPNSDLFYDGEKRLISWPVEARDAQHQIAGHGPGTTWDLTNRLATRVDWSDQTRSQIQEFLRRIR